MKTLRYLFIAPLTVILLVSTCPAETLKVAVASNALKAVSEVAARFKKGTGNTILISAGSTSKLYTQILQGAPFDIFLAANEHEPAILEQKKLVVAGSRFTYAVGQLVLYSKIPGLFGANGNGEAFLRQGHYQRLAMANPDTAPYGNAARQVLEALQLWKGVQENLIRGENIGQAFNYVYTGNASAGFVAWSDVKQQPGGAVGSIWRVPQKYYSPLRQQAIILKRTPAPHLAQQFIDFLRSKPMLKLLKDDYGYGTE